MGFVKKKKMTLIYICLRLAVTDEFFLSNNIGWDMNDYG